MDELSDKKIIDSWRKNVTPWVAAVQEKQIESRKLITDQAIIDAVASVSAESVLDIGCGEGWLIRELSALGLAASGIDVIPALVEKAKQSGAGSFQVLAYEEISESTIKGKFDIAVCNFSLLGEKSVEHVFQVIPQLLNSGGSLVLQTLHPCLSTEKKSEYNAYSDGWRKGSWEGFSDEFCDPAPWYFRTVASWLRLFLDNGYKLEKIIEPLHPLTGKPASLIIIGSVAK